MCTVRFFSVIFRHYLANEMKLFQVKRGGDRGQAKEWPPVSEDAGYFFFQVFQEKLNLKKKLHL